MDVDVPFREAVVGALDRFGIDVSWRARILGLFDTLEEADPIGLVLSADLPGSDPLELLRSVRRSRWSELPIFVIVDGCDRQFELRAYVEGADAVLERDGCASGLAAHILGHANRRRRRRRGAARELADTALGLTGGERRGRPEPIRSAHPWARWSDRSPAAPALTPPAPGVPAPGEITNGVSHAAASRTSRERDRVPVAEAAVPDVILVDDDPSLLEMLRYALTNRGYRTLSLSNGLDALRALRDLDTGDQRPVVLLDVDLPGLDGFRILHELGGCRPGDYQVILCTIHSSEATQVLGIQSGAVDYIVKPFRMPVVLAKVERLLGPARATAGA